MYQHRRGDGRDSRSASPSSRSKPDIVASPRASSGHAIAHQDDVQLTLNNDGGGASGRFRSSSRTSPRVGLLSLATSSTIASIARRLDPGDALLTPPAGLALGPHGQYRWWRRERKHLDPVTFLNQSTAVGNLDITTVR